MSNWRIYEFLIDGETVFARGTDKNEAWGKVGFEGLLVDAMTQAEFDARFALPEVLP